LEKQSCGFAFFVAQFWVDSQIMIQIEAALSA
jgi:hypothetical protein